MTHDGIQFAKLERLESEESHAWLAWFNGSGNPPSDTLGVRFALAHCDAGVTWGYLASARWRLSSEVDPELSPVPTVASLHELRLFGHLAEVLIWRSEQGLSGRSLADWDGVEGVDDALRPIDEKRFLCGCDRPSKQGDFIRYTGRGGAEHLAPASLPLRSFGVRHYLEQDRITGAVRIAATLLQIQGE